MEHGLKDVAFYVQKHIAPQTICYKAPLIRDMPLGRPHLWDSSIAACLIAGITLFRQGLISYRPVPVSWTQTLHTLNELHKCQFSNSSTHWGLVMHFCMWTGPTSVPLMAWRMYGTEPLLELMTTSCKLKPQTSNWIWNKRQHFSDNNFFECRLLHGSHFVHAPMC